MAEELRAVRAADGEPYRLIELPLPAAHHDETGRRLPAGYANFLILNGAVLVPLYGDPLDTVARGVIPFMIADLIVLALLVAFPAIVLVPLQFFYN